MAKNLVSGIDIGTHSIKVTIAQAREDGAPLVLGSGIKHTHGLKNGYITNSHEVTKALQVAVAKAEQAANVEIEEAYLGIGGIGLDSIYSSSDISIARAEGRVNEADIKKVIDKAVAKAHKQLVNRKVLHKIALSYKVDGQEVLGEPVGLRANKLSADVMIVATLEPHYRSMKEIVESLDIEVLDILASPIAASLVVLSKEQKEAGCVLANIGAETVSIVVYEDGVPISLKVFPTGSADITNDIALKLQIPLKRAEELKQGKLFDQSLSQKKLDDIISARLKEMFSLIRAHLKEIGKDGLLPAGVILTGGGVGLAHIKDLARVALKLPSELARLKIAGKSFTDSTWAVSYGLCIYGAGQINERRSFSLPGNFGFKEFFAKILRHFTP